MCLGLIEPTPAEIRKKRQQLRTKETMTVDLLHRAVPVIVTDEGLRALSKDEPINPTSVEGYLESKFGEALAEVRAAMTTLAREFNLAEPTLAP